MEMEPFLQYAQSSLPPVLASIATFTTNKVWDHYRKKRSASTALNIAEQRSLYEKQRALTEEVNVLLTANKSYREEIKNDLDLLKKELEESTLLHRVEMENMKKEYEEEIQRLQSKLSELASELLLYRRENGALHLLLTDRGIEIPSWVKKSAEK